MIVFAGYLRNIFEAFLAESTVKDDEVIEDSINITNQKLEESEPKQPHSNKYNKNNRIRLDY